MLKYITIIFALLLAVLDFIAYRRIRRFKIKKVYSIIFGTIIAIANLIPLSVPLFMFVFNNDNNGTLMMKLSMVLLTFFIVLTLFRLIIYVFWLPSSNKKMLYYGGVVGLFSLILLVYGIFVTRTDYKINEIELVYKNLPASFDGYRIAFISDIHVGSMYNAEDELKKVASLVSEAGSDILLFGGDLVNLHHSELTYKILEKLSDIKGKNKCLAVLGNHDTGAYLKDSLTTPHSLNKSLIEDKLRTIGWTLLRDSTIFIYRNSDSISITGIDYTDELLKFKHYFKNIVDYDLSSVYSCIDDEIFNITISHLPQLWYELCENGYSDLTLSGHIHAMQFKYKIFGHVLSPAVFMYDEWSGLYESEKGKLYINDGIGTVGFFARLGARPEITVITLRSRV